MLNAEVPEGEEAVEAVVAGEDSADVEREDEAAADEEVSEVAEAVADSEAEVVAADSVDEEAEVVSEDEEVVEEDSGAVEVAEDVSKSSVCNFKSRIIRIKCHFYFM